MKCILKGYCKRNELFGAGGVYGFKPAYRRLDMKTTSRLAIGVTAALGFCLISTSVWAGSKQRHRWEGVAIGVGAAIVGSALINHPIYGYDGGSALIVSSHYRQSHRKHRGYAGKNYGFREHRHDRYCKHRRTHGYDRGDRYRGHRRYLRSYSDWRRGIRRSYEQGYRDGRRSHGRRHGVWR